MYNLAGLGGRNVTIGKDITPTDVRKALAILIKSNILKRKDFEPTSNDTLWGVGDKPLSTAEMLLARDVAIVSRIINACKEEKIPFDKGFVQKLLYSSAPSDKIDSIVQLASKMSHQAT